MKHSVNIHLKKCRELYKKWDGFKAMPVARDSGFLYSDELFECSEEPVKDSERAITAESVVCQGPTGASMNGDTNLLSQSAIPIFRLPCATCARRFCVESLARLVVCCICRQFVLNY